MTKDPTILVGTTKGAFLIRNGPDGWTVDGPHAGGWPINHVKGEPATGHIWAGGGNAFFGAGVWRSTDGGATWTNARLTKGEVDAWAEAEPEVAEMLGIDTSEPAPFGDAFNSVWSIGLSNGTLYAGTRPAQLLASTDGGATWTMNTALEGFDGRGDWSGGAAGLTLHTIVPDPARPARLWLGISAAGVFATEDGGKCWERRNRLSNAEASGHHHHPAAPRNGQTGHCVHNMVRARGTGGDTLYQQNHHGVWRSRDGGRSWDDITGGLPSTFGFPIAVHPHDDDTLWTLPLNGDSAGRFPPGAAAAVWRSTDAGETWEAMRTGLPQQGCFFTVLRQAMATDDSEAGGVWFGTNTGSVFGSHDAGETWTEIARHLPTILSVETLTT
ncbi:exo-alpha-sialidase [Alphaproteobacteria bacterium GH1-50]|uniref:Exo-alpha-sialidase n=1 Tax=Kangsaoukella pontilimi TaxID=2691042 RepID=A0A7C9MF30_9RHOB|nr:sialidase family protein [Kangsaoukella pontilimi]MXQ09231.1 exo-alpha-sialidase [Kangsaoukella pontilimi]